MRACPRGVYVLVFTLRGWYRGPLGKRVYVQLPPGVYAYVGSGRGRGGVCGRLRRHLCGRRRGLWWHIDYIASSGVYEPLAAVYCGAPGGVEPLLAGLMGGSRVFVSLGAGLGGSDDPYGFGHFFACVVNDVSYCLRAAWAVAAGLGCLPGVVSRDEFCSLGETGNG